MALGEPVDGNLPQRKLGLDCPDIGSRWSMVALSAETSTAYALRAMSDGLEISPESMDIAP
jgi:hypothetical protein